MNNKINIIIGLMIAIYGFIIFGTAQLSNIKKELKNHDKVIIEALSCVEDPECTITFEHDDKE